MAPQRIAVCIATTGRPGILTETLRNVAMQTRRPDRVLLCPVRPNDIDEGSLQSLALPVEIVHGKAGLAAQRNTILRAAADVDLVLFIDDDFLCAETYIGEMERLFAVRPDCMVATGLVLADGATNRGYSVPEGRAIIAGHFEASRAVAPIFNAYGCNMAIRWSRLRDTGCAFDENLPLYAWAEDVDFSRQAAAYGSVLKSDALIGVHLAEKKGRVSGVRFGYSQIANQIYLARKGTITVGGGLRKVFENMAANLVGAVRNNEAYVDRRGRLIGNLHALLDVLTGRSSPGRIMHF